jgi:hypothetical protein
MMPHAIDHFSQDNAPGRGIKYFSHPLSCRWTFTIMQMDFKLPEQFQGTVVGNISHQ